MNERNPWWDGDPVHTDVPTPHHDERDAAYYADYIEEWMGQFGCSRRTAESLSADIGHAI